MVSEIQAILWRSCHKLDVLGDGQLLAAYEFRSSQLFESAEMFQFFLGR